MSLLGIDVGTTGCKAGAYRHDGVCLASAYREYPTLHPRPGWAELDSAQVWTCVCEVIREVTARISSDPPSALCVSSMGEAMTPVSKDRSILGNAILCSDIRGAEYVEPLRARFGDEGFYRINPNILTPAYSMPKLAWLRDHEPETYRRADRFLLWTDLVGFMLGGEPVTSYAHANRTLLFDIGAAAWSSDLIDAANIAPSLLPEVAPTGAPAGAVSDAAAAQTGLRAGTPIIVGAHDQCCNAVGAGIVRAERAVCGIGTFECYTPVFRWPADQLAMLRNGLNIEHHAVPDLYVAFVYNQSGSLVRWFRDTFAQADRRLVGDREDIYDVLSAEMPSEPTSLLVLPYFEPTGPPGFVGDAAGAIVGLKTHTDRGEILKAIMECATLYFAESLEALRDLGLGSNEFVATGGGAKSDAWLQIKADVLGAPFVRPRTTEGSVLGAAMIAGVATGAFADYDDAAAAMVQYDRRFEPDPARHTRYAEKAQVFARLYPALREVFSDPRC